MNKPDLSVSVCGVPFQNPVIAASGCFGFGQEMAEYVDLNALGGISIKGLTPKPRLGNPAPRIAETPSGMLNSVGLQNPGIDAFLEVELPRLAKLNCRILANVAGSSVEDYAYMTEKLANQPVDMVELNISCPNVKEGGVAFGVYPDKVYEVVSAAKAHCTQPLVVKLTPNTADITATALAAEKAGADAISLINTLTGMAVDFRARRPILANVTGGPVRPGGKAGGAADGIPGSAGGQRAGHRHGRHRQRPGCAGIHAVRRQRRAGGHGESVRSICLRAHCRGDGTDFGGGGPVLRARDHRATESLGGREDG